MAEVSREEKVAEAVLRMESIGIFDHYIRSFEKTGRLEVSEPPLGALYWADDELLKQVEEFENSCNGLVYMVVRSFTSIGTMDSFLYVSDYKEEWEDDRRILKQGETCAYVCNQDDPILSELGYIGVQVTAAGGLRRTH